MGQQLLSMYPIFAQTIHKIDQVLRQNGFPGCLDIINASRAPEDENIEETTQMQAFQSAIFALEVGLAELLTSWGVTPTAVIGHSLGEYAALVSAGVLDVTSGALLVARRAQLLATECELVTTSMLAVNMPAAKVQMLVRDESAKLTGLEISCDNSPTDCVVGGPIQQLNDLKGFLAEHHAAKSKFLQVPMAYHTQAVDPMLAGLLQFARRLTLSKPRLPVISTVLGRLVQSGEAVFTPEYLEQHTRGTVCFQQGLASFLSSAPHTSASTTHWIEVGPHASLLPMVKAQLSLPPQATGLFLPCLRKSVSPSSTLSQLLAQMYQKGLPVDWRQAFHYRNQPRFISLPGLPFFQTEFVIAYPRESTVSNDVKAPASRDMFLGQTIQAASEANGWTGIYETPIHSLKDFIAGHIVCEHALCPASVYHQMALSAAKELTDKDTVSSLSHVEYISPLLYTEQSTALVRIVISPGKAGSRDRFTFEVSSRSGPTADQGHSGKTQVHCRGQIKVKSSKSAEQKHSRTTQVMKRQVDRLSRPDPHTVVETLSTRAIYDHVFPRVVSYSDLYRLVQSIRISPDYGEAHARCVVPASPNSALTALDGASRPSAAKSIFMDVLLHVAGFVANMSVSNGVACICKEVASALVLREPKTAGTFFDVCCTLTVEDDCIVADAQACDESGFMASFSGMVFQKVQLNKISKSFDIAARRTSPQVPTSPQKSISKTHAKIQASTPVPETRIGDVPELELPRATLDIRELVAQTYGAAVEAVTSGSSLEELGFDSLLLIELQSQLSSRYSSLDATALGECVTVSDIEKLCAGFDEGSSTSSISVTASPVSCHTPVTEPVDNDVQRMTRLIVAETCSTDLHSIDSSSELVALGIDSLMIYELESSLASLSKDGSLTMSKLSECRTVGDVEKLVRSLNP
jgi:malonyl CoA-acyl carrier protein transacylase/acyl carrier protein